MWPCSLQLTKFFLLVLFLHQSSGLIPPRFQWKTVDYSWTGRLSREDALKSGDYIPRNNMPSGIARWKDKLFITIPRWKSGVPSSLNYVYVNEPQSQGLHPYPSWEEGFLSHQQCCTAFNSTVVNTFKPHVDEKDRLWVVDNGVADMLNKPKQIAPPAILVFCLNGDRLFHKHELDNRVLRHNSVLTSIVVEVPPCKKGKLPPCTYAYITDAGSGAIIVYNLEDDECWRIDNPLTSKVNGVALSEKKSDGFRDLYFFSSSKPEQFKISTKYLHDKKYHVMEVFQGVEIVGEREPSSIKTACDFDRQNNILFFTEIYATKVEEIVEYVKRKTNTLVRVERLEVNKNGIGCWNTNNPYSEVNAPVIFSDCNVMEDPHDVQVDDAGNIWMLSNRQTRFLNNSMDFSVVNFRVLTAPVANFIQGTACEKQKCCKWFSRKSK